MQSKVLFTLSEVQAKLNDDMQEHADGNMTFSELLKRVHEHGNALSAIASARSISVTA